MAIRSTDGSRPSSPLFIALLTLLLAVFSACSHAIKTIETDKTMLTMHDGEEVKNWRSLNDNVMGGISVGGITASTGHANFSGVISLENNGGFSSITRQAPTIPDGATRVTLEVEGDGKTYQFRFITYIRGYRLGYKQTFATKANERQKIVLSLPDFVPSFRGRTVVGAPELTPAMIQELSFLHTNKQAEPFALKIYQITID